jgi:preprotein translocase subunit YajC
MGSFFQGWLIAAESAETGVQATSGTAALIASFAPFAIVLAVFYFFIIRPQQQQQKQRDAMLSALEKGDKIITTGGIYGEIVELRDDSCVIRVADKVQLKITRSAVAKVID